MALFFTSMLILFVIQSSVVSFVFGALSKCCPLNYELSLGKNYTADLISSQNLTCQLSTVATLSVTHLSNLEIGLPQCQQLRLVSAYSKYQQIACMDRIGQLNDVYGLSCVGDQSQEQNHDLHLKGDSGRKKPTSHHNIRLDRQYHKNPNLKDETYNDENNIEESKSKQKLHQLNSFHVTSLTNVRKCCPANRKYAADRQFCWSEFSNNYTNALMDLLKLSIHQPDRFVNVTFGAPPCRPSNVLTDTVISSKLVSFENDALLLNSTSEVYSFDEYCVDIVDDLFEYLVVRSCRDHWTECQNKGRLCVRKCCPAGFEIDKRSCVPSTRPLKLLFYNVTQFKGYVPKMVPVEAKPAFVFGDPCKEGKFALNTDEAELAHVLTTTGSVFMTAKKMVLDRGQYCVDNRKSRVSTSTFACFPEVKVTEDNDYLAVKVKEKVMAGCSAVSAVFLIITFFIYLLLPSLRNLHGKLIMCYLMTSALSYLTVVVARTLSFEHLPTEICVITGYIMQFTFLSSFSWLNIISYDIWSTFRAVRSAFLKKSNTLKRFSIFCLYGWGSSFLWTGLTVICQYTAIISATSPLKPDIGKNRCFFSEFSKNKLIFFVAPVLTMISFNVIIFIFTVKYCASIRAELKKSNNNYSLKRFSADKNELIINLKLFIVMGLNWSMELLSLLVEPKNRTFFVISDMMNALGGVFIFCIFVLKRKVLQDLKAKLCGNKASTRTFERATGCTTSTTSSIIMNFMNSRRSRSVSVNP